MHKRRKYSQEYKHEAVQLVRQSDIPLAQVAKNLGINPNILRRWGTEISQAGKNAFSGVNPLLTEYPRNRGKTSQAFIARCTSYFLPIISSAQLSAATTWGKPMVLVSRMRAW